LTQAKGLFPISKATLRLTGITAMNTAMTNFLLALMVFRACNPKPPPTKTFKDISNRVIDVVLETAKASKLKKGEMKELEELAESYKEILKTTE